MLAIACLCSLIHGHAETYDVQIGDLRYSVNTETLEASVSAANKDISGDVVIPASIEADPDGVMHTYAVTSIGWNAFWDCTSLTSATIPNSVISIGSYAFWDCTSLTSATIPNSVISIGSYAFWDCTSLTRIEVESGNPNYASSDGVLYSKNMTSLLQCPGAKTAVDIPNSVTFIGYYAFYNCTSLASVTIPESVISIGWSAFEGCTSLASVAIPNSVTSIGEEAFNGCTSLASATIPNSVTSIGAGAFGGCTSLASVTIPNSVTSIGEEAFNGCTSLASVTLSESLTSIGAGAFGGCTSLASVTIPNSVTSIRDHAFEVCTSLASVTIPESVTSIGVGAFGGCTSLASVTIPNSVTSIEGWAFAGCTNLEKVYCLWDIPITCDWAVWNDANYSNATLYVPAGCIPAYQAATPWASFLKIEEHAISGIDPAAAVGNEAKTIVATYDISGRKMDVPVNGINIIRYSDGTTRKVVVRNRR